MLDFSKKNKDRIFEICWMDETILELGLLTQKEMKLLMELEAGMLENWENIVDITAIILNKNTNGIIFTKEEIGESLDVGMLRELFTSYMRHVNKILGELNSL